MEPILPFWFKQRQGKAEPAGENTYRLTAPNQAEAFISVRPAEDDGWVAAVRGAADGPEDAVSHHTLRSLPEAWDAAFELYRRRFIV